jgi:cardiolipin synthase
MRVAGVDMLMDDQLMRQADRIFNATPNWARLLIVFALCLLGCATHPDPAAPGDATSLLDLDPDGAFYRDGQLVLQYSLGREKAFLMATWTVNDLSPDRHNYRTSVIDLATDEPASADSLQRDWQRVTLFDNARWTALVAALLDEMAPDNPATGTLVVVQGRDIVLQRDDAGRLHSYQLESKPAALRIGRRISEEAFAARANDYLQAELLREGKASGPVLFVVGEDELGAAFVLFDFSRRQSVFIAQPPSPLPPGRKLGYSMRLIDSLTFRSHVFTALGHPVTMTNRLLWLATHSGAVLLPHGTAAANGVPPPLAAGTGMDLAKWEQQLDTLVGAEQYRGSMEPLIDGEAFFVSLVQAIQDARESVEIRLYIFDSDDYALRIADLLKRRSHAIRVRVLVDQLGTLAAGQIPSASPYYSRSKPPVSIAAYLKQDSNIEVRTVNNPWLTSDHTKVIVVDRNRAYVGGMNIGREYRYEWHDLMVELNGPIVGRLLKDFDKRWAYAGFGGDLAFAIASLKDEPYSGEADEPGFIDIRPLYTRTGDAQILRAQLAAIRQARSRIYVEQPYVSEDEVIAELIRARRRGVDVRVVLPVHSDSGFMNGANLLAARAFISNGVRVYGYPGMTHVKAALFDGWACLGSANFDKLSLRINQETDLATSDPHFVEQLQRELFEVDFARSTEWTEAKPVGWNDYIAEFIADQL